jgi:YD repeat-containing protein
MGYEYLLAARMQEGERVRTIPIIGALLGVLIGKAAGAAETITYTYDAKGRLVRVVHTGTVNNNVQVDYTHDKSNNRLSVVRTKP